MTQSTDQERAEFTDGAWYWVEKEGWHDEPPKIAPAMYRADCDAWYSWEFSGISTEYLKVLEPCVRHEQAARRAPVGAVPQAPCVICGSDAPYTGTCGSNDPRALCKKPAPQPPEAAPVQLPEPDSYIFQHEETGLTQFVDAQQVEWGFEKNNPRWKRVGSAYTEQQVRDLLAANGIEVAP